MATSVSNRELERSIADSHRSPANVSWAERLASIAAGAQLVAGTFKNITSHPVRNIALAGAGGYLLYRGLTGDCALYSFINSMSSRKHAVNINIRTSVYVDKPRQEVYDFWRNLENLPLFMKHLNSVRTLGGNRSKWEAKMPANVGTITWDAEIVNEEPGKVIGWRSLAGSEIDNAGKVEFMDSDDGRGTVIQAIISYMPPTRGFVKSKIAGLLSPVFEKLVRSDINNFKNYIEGQGDTESGYLAESQNFGQTEI